MQREILARIPQINVQTAIYDDDPAQQGDVDELAGDGEVAPIDGED